MIRFALAWTCLLFIAAVPVTGCGHKTDAKAQMEQAVSVLAKAEANTAPPSPAPPAEPAPAATPQQLAPVGEVPLPRATPAAQQMQQALAAYRTGELVDSVTRLQNLRFSTALTAEQRMTIQDTVAAVMAEIYGLAEKGDPRAIQAVKQYEEMSTSRH